MKLQIASDLHLEFIEDRYPGFRIVEPAEDADLLVLAGDIHHAARAFDAFADWPVPVLYVHGNHELYRQQYDDALAELRAASHGGNVTLLERDELVIDGVRILGCCLWTDYTLYRSREDEAMREAELTLADHKRIRVGDRFFTADDALERHAQSRAWLEEKLAQNFDGKTVVITHHAPHPGSIHPRYAGSLLNAAFATDLSPLVARADLWIHGHVHDSFDYTVGTTRIVANPRGYVRNRWPDSPAGLEWENPLFAERFVVTV